MAETETAPQLDDETTAALTLFNEYVDADRERTRREKRLKKAERAKDDAATALRKASESGTGEEKAKAEEAYREAQETLRKLRDGEEPAGASTDRTDDDAEDAADSEPGAEKAESPADNGEASSEEE